MTWLKKVSQLNPMMHNIWHHKNCWVKSQLWSSIVTVSSQVEEALKILMAYCSLGEEYQADYFHPNIHHHDVTRKSCHHQIVLSCYQSIITLIRCMWRRQCQAGWTVSGNSGWSTFSPSCPYFYHLVILLILLSYFWYLCYKIPS